MSDSHVYVHCKNHHWVPARVVEKQGDDVIVTIPQYSDEQRILSDGGKGAVQHIRQTVSLSAYPNKVLPLQNVDEMGWLNEEKDMVDLPFLHEAAILYNLKSRHVRGKPYTRTGDIVIAVNPYEWFHNLYTKERRQEYARKLIWDPESGEDVRRVLEPHVYETSALSYKGLTLEGMNQSILVSGESGAGKTETVKICMNHIAMVQQGPGASQGTSAIVERVVQSNPLLEAFGNAQTRRNDNSSRFGKYLQLQFEMGEKQEMPFGDHSRSWQDCKLAGSQSEVYLLEKSRVVHHDDSERTFHIFYQLLAAPDLVKGKFWPNLVGKTNESFKYVGATNTTRIEGKSDAQHFQDTLSALALVNITGAKLQTIMQAISTVLQLGNIGFSGCADKSKVSTVGELRDLADLMGVSVDTLEQSLTKRTMRTTRETVLVDLNAETAKDSCDALAKAIYHEAFLWLVREINVATKAENTTTDYKGDYGIIGLLDIFGFECFQRNSFEQLCINYANEKLQQKFTEDIFRQVQAEYKFEGLALEDIRYDDNQHVLDLIESRMGILDMLNEECVRPKGNDKEFVYKAIQQNKDSKALIVEKRFSPYEFGIHHYAGDVLYTAGNFVGKNNDTLAIDLKNCAGASTNEIISGVPAAAEVGRKRPVGRNTNSMIAAATVWTKYKNGLQNLMGELRKTNSRYIRCIKPNEMKMPAVMQHGPTLDQLRSAGVISAVTITRSAFPNRLDHESVLDRFKHLARKSKKGPVPDNDLRKRVERLIKPLLKHMTTESNGRKLKAYAIGKTRTYFRAGALEYLEAERIRGFDPAATSIQKVARGFLVRKRQRNDYIRDRGAALLIQTHVRVLLAKNALVGMRKQKDLLEKQNQAATVINAIARGVVRRMRFEEELRYYREVTAMKNELARLQMQVAESERQKKEAVEAAEARVQEAMAMLKEEQSSDSSASADASETARLLNERNKQIEKMRADNKRVRANIKLVENRFKKLKEESTKKKIENEKELEKFLKMNEQAKQMNEENTKAIANQGIWKKQVTALVEEMKRTQESFQEATNSRAQYQETMAGILKMIRTRCKEEQLIEDSIFIALESDSESKAILASFDAVQAHLAEKEKSLSVPQDIDGNSDSEDPTAEKPATTDPTEVTDDSSSAGDVGASDSSVSSPDLSDDDIDIDFEKEEAEMEAELAELTTEVEGM